MTDNILHKGASHSQSSVLFLPYTLEKSCQFCKAGSYGLQLSNFLQPWWRQGHSLLTGVQILQSALQASLLPERASCLCSTAILQHQSMRLRQQVQQQERHAASAVKALLLQHQAGMQPFSAQLPRSLNA